MPYLLCSREMLGVRAGVDLRRIVALENRTRPLLRKLLENLVSPVRVCQPVNTCFAVITRREHFDHNNDDNNNNNSGLRMATA